MLKLAPTVSEDIMDGGIEINNFRKAIEKLTLRLGNEETLYSDRHNGNSTKTIIDMLICSKCD